MKIINDNMNFMSENGLDLVDFLLLEMKKKNLAPIDITKRGGLSPSQVSKILNRESPAGPKAIEKFAIALNLPVDLLYQYAGLFTKPIDLDEKREELLHLFSQMSDENREDTVDYARMKLQKQEREVRKSGKRDRVVGGL